MHHALTIRAEKQIPTSQKPDWACVHFLMSGTTCILFLFTWKRNILWVGFQQVIRHSLVTAQTTDQWLTTCKPFIDKKLINYNRYKLTPSSDEDHGELESSSTSQGPHAACSQDCWQESKTNVHVCWCWQEVIKNKQTNKHMLAWQYMQV